MTSAKLTNAEIVDRFLGRIGVSFTVASAGWREVPNDRQSLWKCLFKRPGKQWTIRFHMGSGHKDAATAYDVLDCVVSDYWTEINDDWEDLGFEKDEIITVRAATLREIEGFRRFFTVAEFQLLIDHLNDYPLEEKSEAFTKFEEGE